MNNLIKVNNKELEIKEYEGQRVVTFKEIDYMHERVGGTAGRNFRDNKKHFIKDVDYFEVTTKNVVSLETSSIKGLVFSKVQHKLTDSALKENISGR